MRRTHFTLAAVLLVALAPGCPLFAGDRPGAVSIWLQAKPAESCFPASSLQLPELEKDFLRLCPEFEFTRDRQAGTDFRVVVEDPDFRWHLAIFDAEGTLLRELDWYGPLDHGLAEAASTLRQPELAH